MTNEVTFYNKFAMSAGGGDSRKRIECVPKFIGSGKLQDGRAYLITEYVKGQTLDNYVKQIAKDRPFENSDDYTRNLAIVTFQVFSRVMDAIQEFHKFFLIHRDLKPQNILVQEDGKVLLIDFGTVINYRMRNGDHIEFQNGKSRIGSAFFASPYSHLGFNQSRRDDIIQLAFSMLYIMDSVLVADWVKGLSKKTSVEVWDQLCLKKQEFMSKKSEYNQLTHQFIRVLIEQINYLEFQSEPDYERYKKLFKEFEELLQARETQLCLEISIILHDEYLEVSSLIYMRPLLEDSKSNPPQRGIMKEPDSLKTIKNKALLQQKLKTFDQCETQCAVRATESHPNEDQQLDLSNPNSDVEGLGQLEEIKGQESEESKLFQSLQSNPQNDGDNKTKSTAKSEQENDHFQRTIVKSHVISKDIGDQSIVALIMQSKSIEVSFHIIKINHSEEQIMPNTMQLEMNVIHKSLSQLHSASFSLDVLKSFPSRSFVSSVIQSNLQDEGRSHSESDQSKDNNCNQNISSNPNPKEKNKEQQSKKEYIFKQNIKLLEDQLKGIKEYFEKLLEDPDQKQGSIQGRPKEFIISMDNLKNFQSKMLMRAKDMKKQIDQILHNDLEVKNFKKLEAKAQTRRDFITFEERLRIRQTWTFYRDKQT
ncbi:hypothetical protein FGO68_gene15561 [Halteria grandinella]|uniref:Casein kinase I n=1 Tax=Halteria grandinella TaxID=5974 RepID=A0A8J8T4S5_HALGN|nr:hypothetical protein FGO68_gene15561 [Halteria grandinella]